MTTKQWAIIIEKLVCTITSSRRRRGRKLTLSSPQKAKQRSASRENKNAFWEFRERSSFSLPRQGSQQCYYTSSCLSSAVAFLCGGKKKLCNLDCEKTLKSSLLRSSSQTLVLLSLCRVIYLLTLQEVGWEQKNHINTKWLLRARSEQWIQGAFYQSISLLLCIAMAPGEVIAVLTIGSRE